VGNDAYSPVPPSAYDLLETEILTGSQASVTFSSLNSTYGADYQHLQLRAVSRNDRNVGYYLGEVYFELNSVTGSGQYYTHYLTGNGSTVYVNAYSKTTGAGGYDNPSLGAPANTFAASVTDFLDVFDTTKNTTIRTLAGVHTGGTGLNGDPNAVSLRSGAFFSTSAIDSIKIIADFANFVSGSRFSLYGLKAA